jgi:biopolymer transport protein ExbD
MRQRFAVLQQAGEEEQEINITPMLDVVFIMLIFFIVTASFVKEAGLDVNKPQSQTSQPQDEQRNILIRIDAQGGIWVDGRKVDPRAVRANIERASAENPDGKVVIQADRDAVTRDLVHVMDQARLAGVYDVAIAELEPAP